MSRNRVAQRSVSDQTATRSAISLRLAQRSQSIPIPILRGFPRGRNLVRESLQGIDGFPIRDMESGFARGAS